MAGSTVSDNILLPKYIAEQARRLEEVGIESAKVEIEWILCHVLEVDRLNLYLNGATLLSEQALARCEEIIRQRLTRYPLQFILQESWFYGRKFFVTPDVMAPTPETERLCENAVRFIRVFHSDKSRVLDVGTGSGVIAVTVAAESENARVVALDISAAALEVARKNARDLATADRIEFRQSDLFSAVRADEKFDLILSNPPYIREGDYAGLPPEVKADPKIAMTAGTDGLDVVRLLVAEAPNFLAPGGRLMFEIGYDQSERVATLTESDPRYMSMTFIKDYNDYDRVVVLACEE